MRCKACNKVLSDYEATRKYAQEPRDYVDLCSHCFNASDLQGSDVIERYDLLVDEDMEYEQGDWETSMSNLPEEWK